MSYRINLFLNFVRAAQIRDWALHHQSTAEIVSWYFVYDHLYYSRYLPVYIYEMLDIPDTHPSIAEHPTAGDFVAQQ